MSSPSGAPFDPGLQPERTLLAWRRTCLALAVGGALVVRFTTEAVGAAGAVLGVLGVVIAAAAYVRASVRYRRAHEGLTADGALPIDGVALALLSVTLLLIGAGAAAYVLGVGLPRVS